jgi:hypothetical protein
MNKVVTQAALSVVTQAALSRSGTISGGQQNKAVSAQKRRLFQIALQTSICLLLNVVVTITTSLALEDWSRTSSIWLHCKTLEREDSRDWDAYQVIYILYLQRLNDLAPFSLYGLFVFFFFLVRGGSSCVPRFCYRFQLQDYCY